MRDPSLHRRTGYWFPRKRHPSYLAKYTPISRFDKYGISLLTHNISRLCDYNNRNRTLSTSPCNTDAANAPSYWSLTGFTEAPAKIDTRVNFSAINGDIALTSTHRLPLCFIKARS